MKYHIHSLRDLEQRRNWYSDAAIEYDKVRPKYPDKIIQRACEIAQLSPKNNLLEIGAGPATATLSFAQRGYHVVSLEPSKDLYQLAKKNCRPFNNVELVNTTFEEWDLQEESFDAVFAPTSIHWVSPEVVYPKVAKALREDGYFMLFWNMPLRPPVKMHQSFEKIYKEICPSLYEYKDNDALRDQIEELGENLKNSDLFGTIQYEEVTFDLTYSASEFVQYLNTNSNYLKLEENTKVALFNALTEKIKNDFADQVELSGLVALQIAKKNRVA